MKKLGYWCLDYLLVPLVLVFAIVGAGLLVENMRAQTPLVPVAGDAFAYEALSAPSTSVTRLTASTYAPSTAPSAKTVYITVETQAIRYRMDGADPTTSEGHSVAVNGMFAVSGTNNITHLRIIAVTGTAAIKVTYLR